MSGMTEEFGSMVFSDAVMQQRLPAEIYSALGPLGKRLTLAADVVAEASATGRSSAARRIIPTGSSR